MNLSSSIKYALTAVLLVMVLIGGGYLYSRLHSRPQQSYPPGYIEYLMKRQSDSISVLLGLHNRRIDSLELRIKSLDTRTKQRTMEIIRINDVDSLITIANRCLEHYRQEAQK